MSALAPMLSYPEGNPGTLHVVRTALRPKPGDLPRVYENLESRWPHHTAVVEPAGAQVTTRVGLA
jgi:hypothetical protein